MSSTQQLFLDQEYVLDGVTLTGKQIKNAIVENAIFKAHLQNGDRQ